MSFVISAEDMARMQLIEKMTHAKVKDCIDEGPDKMVIIVQPGELFKALGKNASNVKTMQDKFNKKIRIVEYSEDPVVFLGNLCKPNKIQSIAVEDKTYTIMPQDIKSRGYMIGKAASTLRLHETIMRRYFDVQEIKVNKIEE